MGSGILPTSKIDPDNAHFKEKRKQGFMISKTARFVVGFIVAVLLLLALVQQTRSRPDFPVAKSGGDGDSSASSTECTRSYDGKKPINQYVVMIDAGSSGSRVHVYHFNNCQRSPQLMGERFEMLEPGLSSFENDPKAAAASLDRLLDIAKDTVPADLQSCTPIAVQATAGLRKVGEEKSQKILDAVKEHLETSTPFAVTTVAIMSGEDEGVYAWVTANYLLGLIGTSEKTPTVAVFDLGGGSTQIVFEPTFKDETKKLSDGDHKFSLQFGGRDFDLYQHSYLGFGLNEARNKINRLVVEQQLSPAEMAADPVVATHPCLPPNTSYLTEVKLPDGTSSLDGSNLVERKVEFKGPAIPAPLQCRGIAEKILEKNAVCANPPCSFNGVHQPALFEAFPADSDMYVFSFFYDRTSPLGMPTVFSVDDLWDLTKQVCSGELAYSAFESVKGAVDALKKNPQWCSELSYMHALLRTGYDIKGQRNVKIAKKINDNELGWCLGASLPLLDQKGWKCRQI